MIRWICHIALALLPTCLQAAPIMVMSGEHEGFTRLVITLEKPENWALFRMEDGYRFSLPSMEGDYDLSKVGDRIGRSRLAEVRQLPGSADLRIVMACACHATAFAFRPEMIVVDVKSGPPPADSPFERPAPVLGLPGKSVGATSPAVLALDWSRRKTEPVATPAPTLQAPRELGQDLAREIGTAASSGLIELAVPDTDSLDDGLLPQLELRIAPTLDMHVGERDPGITIQPECPAADPFEVRNWIADDTTTANFLPQIAELLAPETGEPTDAAFLLASKLYLFYGFGAEARQILNQVSASNDQHEAFIAISHVMDGEPAEPDPFAKLAHCRSSVALWSVLARRQLRPSEPIAADEIYQTFIALPPHLRTLFGGSLIDRMREQGDMNSADRLRSTINRDTTLQGGRFDLAVGRLQMADQDRHAARDALERAAARPGPAEAEALIALVRLAFETRTPLEPERLQNITALEAQFTADPLGEHLREALVTAYALSGEFRTAAQLLRKAPSARSNFWTLLAEFGSPSDLLDFAFTPPPDAATLILREDQLRIARQLAALGFGSQAVQWLTLDDGSSTFDAARQITLATVYLDLYRPRDALTALAGSGPEADDLRARALVALDRKDEAAQVFADQPHSPALLHLYRREGDWPQIAARDTADWSVAAQAYLTAAQPGGEEITLSAAIAALDDAASVKAAVDGLLTSSSLEEAMPITTSAQDPGGL